MPTNPPTDLNQLAIEALDLWQEHLATLASDPKAKADLVQLMEPSRRLFAEWMEKAQSTNHASPSFTPPERTTKATPSPGPAPVQSAFDDGSLRIAQLALHVADLEKRVAKLEARKTRPAAKAANASGQRQ